MILDLIYPPVCGICNKICKEYLCSQCEERIKKYEINKIEDYTQKQGKKFDYLIKLYKYDGIIRKSIIDYKFNDKSYLADTFEKMITKNEKIYGFLKKYDIILSVPLYKKNARQRGYNQSELISRKIAKTTGIVLERNNLIKARETQKQSTLNKIEREKNVKNAFQVKNGDKIKNRKIILFDDIYTTGSTANECSKILKEEGAKEIAVMTLAID